MARRRWMVAFGPHILQTFLPMTIGVLIGVVMTQQAIRFDSEGSLDIKVPRMIETRVPGSDKDEIRKSWWVDKGILHTVLAINGHFNNNGSLKLPDVTEIWLDIGINMDKTTPPGKSFKYLQDTPGTYYLGFEPILDKFAHHVSRRSMADRLADYGGLRLPGVRDPSRGMLFPIAVGNKENNMAEFHVSAVDGCSSLNKQRTKLELMHGGWNQTNSKMGSWASRGCGNTRQLRRVPTITLEVVLGTWLQGHSVEFAHIDVQGGEMDVLESAGSLIKNIKRLLLEVPSPKCVTLTSDAATCHQIIAQLDKMGFEAEDAIREDGETFVGLKRGLISCEDIPFESWNTACEFDVLFVRKDVESLNLENGKPRQPTFEDNRKYTKALVSRHCRVSIGLTQQPTRPMKKAVKALAKTLKHAGVTLGLLLIIFASIIWAVYLSALYFLYQYLPVLSQVALGVCVGGQLYWFYRFGYGHFGVGPKPLLPDLTINETGSEASKVVRFVCISDTHGDHDRMEIPTGDVLIHAGDFTRFGSIEEIKSFNTWLSKLPHKKKIICAGNHDIELDPDISADAQKAEELLDGCVYLNGKIIDVQGVKIYGSPMQLGFSKGVAHAFGRSPDQMKEHWESQLPADSKIDIILTHAPPHGILDRVFTSKRVGDKHLLGTLRRIRPKFCIFGHIHESYGVQADSKSGCICINASSCTMLGAARHPPIVFDIKI
ncbi:hypothetical protein AAMO2058_000927600 [Amorphochlora amoebiformis]